MIRKIILAFLFFLLFFSAVIADGEDKVRDIKAAIYRYNNLLAECYKKLNMNPMQEVATLDHAEKLYIYMAAIGEGKERLESKLKKIDFINIKFPDRNTVIVKDREIWDFRYVNIKTGQAVEEKKDFVYNLIFKLVKKNGRWLVKSVTAA